MALMLEVEPGQVVAIGQARVSVEQKTGSRVRLVIEAPKDQAISLVQAQERPPPKTPGRRSAHPARMDTRHGKHPV